MAESTPDRQGSQPRADIATLRLAIDEIDAKILDLINERLLLAQKIGAEKKQEDTQIIDHRREKDILYRLQRTNNGPLDKKDLHRIFAAIIDAGRSVQTTDRGPK